jgi:hypothetical protein
MAKNSCGITAKMIEVKTWKSGQSAHFRKLVQLNEFKVKIEIKVDSHAPQSYAVASVITLQSWTGTSYTRSHTHRCKHKTASSTTLKN